MKSLLKQLQPGTALQLVIVLDSILLTIQSILQHNQEKISYTLVLFGIQAVILIIEYCYSKFYRLMLILSLIKSITIIGINLRLGNNENYYFGFYIVCINFLDKNNFTILIVCQCITQLVCQSIIDITYIPFQMVKTIICYLLIEFLIRRTQNREYAFIDNILNHVGATNICIFNENFIPLIQNEFYQSIKNKQIIITEASSYCLNLNSSRIISYREQQQNQIPIYSNSNEISSTKLLLDQYIQQLRINKQNYFKTQIFELEGEKQVIIIDKLKNSYFHNYICLRIKSIETNTINNEQEQQQQQEQQSQIQIMIKTLNKVAHDMRNPLNAIINMQTCLIDLIHIDLVKKYLKPSLNSCKLLLALLNDILDAAQVNQKSITLSIKRFNLYKLILKTVNLFELLIEKKQLNVKLNYDCNLDQYIYSDKIRIKQIIMNLLSNAIKYSYTQGEIIIEALLQIGDNNEICISIQDHGIGIKVENQKQLFGQFCKIKDNENQIINPQGIGLGLMISNELALLLGKQTIQIQSQYGFGTKFSFVIHNQLPDYEEVIDSKTQIQIIIPKTYQLQNMNKQDTEDYKSAQLSIYIQGEDSQKQLLMKIQTQHYSHGSFQKYSSLKSKSPVLDKQISLRQTSQNQYLNQLIINWMEKTHNNSPILIVDDDTFNIMTLQYLLESMGINSDSAINGMESIIKVKDRFDQQINYILIFMDIEMPILNGLQTAQKLIQIDSSLKIIPCSGHKITKEQIELYTSIGMQEPIEKPLTKSIIKQVLLSQSLKTNSIN